MSYQSKRISTKPPLKKNSNLSLPKGWSPSGSGQITVRNSITDGSKVYLQRGRVDYFVDEYWIFSRIFSEFTHQPDNWFTPNIVFQTRHMMVVRFRNDTPACRCVILSAGYASASPVWMHYSWLWLRRPLWNTRSVTDFWAANDFEKDLVNSVW